MILYTFVICIMYTRTQNRTLENLVVFVTLIRNQTNYQKRKKESRKRICK